jgi:phytoene/squalene synthetase
MLDTYEDLLPDPAARPTELRRFARRFESDPLEPATAVNDSLARDDRDRLSLLLIDQCHLVDAVMGTLDADTQGSIAELVSSMAEGMAHSAETLRHQGGVLVDREQVARYSHHVIGNPALFILKLIGGGDTTPTMERDALAVSEMIQLANITRDIEKDLDRGIGYHASLKPYLTAGGDPLERRETVRRVREDYLAVALRLIPAYRRLFNASSLHRKRGARLAAVLMLLHTDKHYRRCAIVTGHEPWGTPRGKARMTAAALPALFSVAGARRVLQRVERDFLNAAVRIEAKARTTAR